MHPPPRRPRVGVALSLFFPAFTGFLSGANRASTLADPATAIPYGTLGAISLSYAMYTSFMLLWAAVGEREFLLADTGQVRAPRAARSQSWI